MRTVRSLALIELKLFLRDPVTVIFTLAMPPVWLYVLSEVFGNTPNPVVYRGLGPADYYLPAYVALVAASLGLIGLPVHLAAYRERKVLRRFQAARLPVTALLGSQLAVVVIGVVAGSALLVALSWASYGTATPISWAGVLLSFTLGMLMFGAIGVLLGAVMPTARAAQGIGLILWFAMLMMSGVGPPPEVLSPAMNRIGDFMPLDHLVIALQDPWLLGTVNWTKLGIVVGVGVAAAGISAAALRRRD